VLGTAVIAAMPVAGVTFLILLAAVAALFFGKG
jgi:hypothetical protein